MDFPLSGTYFEWLCRADNPVLALKHFHPGLTNAVRQISIASLAPVVTKYLVFLIPFRSASIAMASVFPFNAG